VNYNEYNDYYEALEAEFQSPMATPAPLPEERLQPWTGETQIVGKPLPRIDAYERVSGTAEYTYDINLPEMLYAAVLRCPHAHAMVKNVDTSAAGKMPGVLGVITGKTPGADVP